MTIDIDDVLYQVPDNLLFRHRFSCPRMNLQWPDPLRRNFRSTRRKLACELTEDCILPHFGVFSGEQPFATVRAAWNPGGLFFDLSVDNEGRPPRCDNHRVTTSDGIQIWIDTRCTQSIHRASRFCHWFAFMPTSDDAGAEPLGTMLKINRAKESPNTFQGFQSCVDAKATKSGYRMTMMIPAASLNGYEKGEHRRVGIYFQVKSDLMGTLSLAVDDTFPISTDPSLWHVMDLV